MSESEMVKRGEWQKKFVQQLVENGVSHNDAMVAMGLCCEERQVAYMQGYNRGFEKGIEYKKINKA
jgi:hypothetical protein